MVVVRSGKAGLKKWREEKRDYVKDFRAAFGEEPTEVKFVGIMIDGDNTKSSGVSYFADIRFLARGPQKAPGKTVTTEEPKP
jgi:hypothetical protein